MKTKKLKNRHKKRGVIPVLSVIMMIAIGTFSMVVGMIMPFVLLRIHLVRTMIFEYKYDNAQQTLETLMSLTRDMQDIYGNTEYKRASKIVGEYITVGRRSTDVDFLEDGLNEMIPPIGKIRPFECYKLSYDSGDKILTQKICTYWFDHHEAAKYNGTIYITTPAGVSTLDLVIE